MLVKDLNAKHPDYDAATWDRYDALYKGGKAFRARVGEFLPKNPQEPSKVHELRKQQAHYRGYLGPIVNYFAARLFAASFVPRVSDDQTPDPFYASFKEDVDGQGTDLVSFMAARFRKALVKERSWWICELPDPGTAPPLSRADWEDRGLGAAKLCELDPDDIYDWECDESGELLWAITHSKTKPRENPRQRRRIVRETWRIYDATSIETYEVEYDPEERKLDPEDEIELVDTRAHGFKRVPLVSLAMPPGLWVADHIADDQVEHFQLSSGLGWSIRRTCYAMPVFKLKDETSAPTMGAGYYLKIGTEESVEWATPDTAPFDVIGSRLDSIKDEIYRVSNQMALGVDNNAAAVGRSAESKSEDASATDVCLKAYAKPVREAIERTYQMIAEAREDDLAWRIEGLDKFNLTDAGTVLANASTVQQLGIPSETLNTELFAAAADAALPDLPQEKKDKIRSEIEKGMVAEHEMRALLKDADQQAQLAQSKMIQKGQVPVKPAPGPAPLRAEG